jgi:hypothetical protein
MEVQVQGDLQARGSHAQAAVQNGSAPSRAAAGLAGYRRVNPTTAVPERRRDSRNTPLARRHREYLFVVGRTVRVRVY